METKYGWCFHCKKSSYLKEDVGYKNEEVAGLVIRTQEFAGRCKFCNRVLQKVIVDVMEETQID